MIAPRARRVWARSAFLAFLREGVCHDLHVFGMKGINMKFFSSSLITIVAAAFVAGCGPKEQSSTPPAAEQSKPANQLAGEAQKAVSTAVTEVKQSAEKAATDATQAAAKTAADAKQTVANAAAD